MVSWHMRCRGHVGHLWGAVACAWLSPILRCIQAPLCSLSALKVQLAIQQIECGLTLSGCWSLCHTLATSSAYLAAEPWTVWERGLRGARARCPWSPSRGGQHGLSFVADKSCRCATLTLAPAQQDLPLGIGAAPGDPSIATEYAPHPRASNANWFND